MSERTFNQISEQYHGPQKEPTVLIRRGDKTIQTAILTQRRDEHGRPWVKFTDPADGIVKGKPIALDNLSDEAQAAMAEEIGGPLLEDEGFVDTLPRSEILERIGHTEQAPDIVLHPEQVGEVALEALDIEEPMASMETRHAPEVATDMQSAVERVSAVLGDGGNAANPLAESLRRGGSSPAEIIAALSDRSNLEFRKEVVHVLGRRMDDLLLEGGHFHERVQANDPNNLKAPNGDHGYDMAKYRSDQYVVLLALAKLDGSFDTSREKDYDDLPDDHIHQGQHRQASNKLLESFVRENSPATPEKEPTDDERLRKARRVIDDLLAEIPTNVRAMNGTTDMLNQLSYNGMIDTGEIYEVISSMRRTAQTVTERLQDATRAMRQLAEEDGIDGDRRTTETIEQALTDLQRTVSSFEGDADTQIRLLTSKTQEAEYERHIQDYYRSSLRQHGQELSDLSHTMSSMLHRIEL